MLSSGAGSLVQLQQAWLSIGGAELAQAPAHGHAENA